MGSCKHQGNYGQGLSRRRFLGLASGVTLNSTLFLGHLRLPLPCLQSGNPAAKLLDKMRKAHIVRLPN